MPTNVLARPSLSKLGVLLSGLLLAAAALWCADGGLSGAEATEQSAAAISEGPSLPSAVGECMAHPERFSSIDLDRIYRLEHRIPVGLNQRIAVTETFTLRSWLRWPRRGMVMIPAQGSNRSVYNIPVEGFDGGAIMACDGFFAFTVDPPGTGDSYQPENGLTVTYESEAAVLATVTNRLRAMRLIPRMDAWGEELGGGVATHLCADRRAFRSCTVSSMLYKTGSDFFYQVAPFFEAFLLSSPDGYFQSFSDSYFNVLMGSPPEVRDWYLATQIGRYASGLYRQDFDRVLRGGPSYDPRNAAVPGLIIRGEFETNNPLSDTQQLAADYGSLGGGRATFTIVPNGTHILRLDAAPVGPSVWDLIKAFVDGPDSEDRPR